MSHFICTGGCGGVSEMPGMCKAEECPFYAEELTECNCEDGEHRRGGEEEGEKNAENEDE
ncbi:hypothetical protein HYW17_05735 [Candidatus Uhrbacteria bacterium]|nr:hypothetical protein [Candidatus Uhrbacteria bacterium]